MASMGMLFLAAGLIWTSHRLVSPGSLKADSNEQAISPVSSDIPVPSTSFPTVKSSISLSAPQETKNSFPTVPTSKIVPLTAKETAVQPPLPGIANTASKPSFPHSPINATNTAQNDNTKTEQKPLNQIPFPAQNAIPVQRPNTTQTPPSSLSNNTGRAPFAEITQTSPQTSPQTIASPSAQAFPAPGKNTDLSAALPPTSPRNSANPTNPGFPPVNKGGDDKTVPQNLSAFNTGQAPLPPGTENNRSVPPTASLARGNRTKEQSHTDQKEQSIEMLGIGLPGAKELEGEQQAQLILNKIVPEEVQVGRQETFKITVKNIGAKKAKNVVVQEEIPAKTVFQSAVPPISANTNGEIIWKGFELAPKEEKVFTYVLIPQEEGDLGSIASVSFKTEVSGRTKSTRPNLQVDVKAPQQVVIGDDVTFEITISNTGSGAANGVLLVENVPQGLSHPGGSILDNQIDTVNPGEAKKLELTLKSASPGKVVNILKLTANNGFNKEVKTELTINAPELNLQISGSKQRYLDRDSTYLLKVENPGTAAAKDVLLSAKLPDNMEFVRTNNLGEYDKDTHSVRWELVELPQNMAPGEIELVLKPVKAGNGRIILAGKGKHGLSAEATQDVQVDGLPALSYTVKTMTDPVEVGKEAVYEIRIANKGTKNSTNICLQILVPEQMKIIDSEGPTRYKMQNGVLVFDPMNELGARKEVVYQLKTICSVPGDHRIKVQVSSDDFERLVKEESVRAYY